MASDTSERLQCTLILNLKFYEKRDKRRNIFSWPGLTKSFAIVIVLCWKNFWFDRSKEMKLMNWYCIENVFNFINIREEFMKIVANEVIYFLNREKNWDFQFVLTRFEQNKNSFREKLAYYSRV